MSPEFRRGRALNDLEIKFARYCFEVSMIARCIETERPVAPYMERANHLLCQVVRQMKVIGELPRLEAEIALGDLLAFDPDIALDEVSSHISLHRQCLQRLEKECLALESSRSERYDLTGPCCLELVAKSHQVLDAARGVLWAVKTFGFAD
jgi:hypothetical protein